jgi:DNA polymerase-3 subunit delta'
MAFKDLREQQHGVQLLQRSLVRGRLGHGYLFQGVQLEPLEELARALAKTLNCQNPLRENGIAIDCCDQCLACRKIDHGNHGDVHWVRPESKTRIITIHQMREVMKDLQLKPTEAEYKVGIIVAADRLKVEAANAFLKTLEEPPARSILILLTTEPQRLLDTIVSRCLRLSFAGGSRPRIEPAQATWLQQFSDLAAAEQKSLLGRYRLLDALLKRLTTVKGSIDETLTARSPIQQYKEAEKELIEKWEDELTAAIEAEYRRQRTDILGLVHLWLRDVWLQTVETSGRGTAILSAATPDLNGLLSFPELAGTRQVAQRLSAAEALENLQVLEQLQRSLYTNVQEALALEVGLLRLKL